MAVVAPTGVAAINAGGVTIHTFFQLPLGAYVPAGPIPDTGDLLFNNKASLLRNLRIAYTKRELFQELELLVIDEVSMVRADLLDAMDTVLRFVRKKPGQPFGGLQVLFIGDLFQLAPVVSDREWSFLKEYYSSPFFFDARVMQEAPPFTIELKTIYRQSDPQFIDLLNKVRNNELDQTGWHQLHEHYKPGFQSAEEDRYITLSTHNNRADNINQQELSRLEGPLYRYEAEITGEFSEKSYPAEELLELKAGAQVMFIKNDKGEFRRYYNGKIGVIESLDEENIYVRFPDEEGSLLLEKETWRNIRYKLDKAKDKIEEEELGTFSQYPIRLAWAITIHKSQGLTFEKAIIDAGAAFAPGQVYVALSRLTGLKGLVLKTRIPLGAIQTDPRVVEYTKRELSEAQLEEELALSERLYVIDYFVQCFRFDGLESLAEDWRSSIEKKSSLARASVLEALERFETNLNQLIEVSQKTTHHFSLLMQPASGTDPDYLLQRTRDALNYFESRFEELDKLLADHAEAMKKETRLTKYQREIREMRDALQVRKLKMEQALPIAEAILKEEPTAVISTLIQELNKQVLANEEARGSDQGKERMSTMGDQSPGESKIKAADKKTPGGAAQKQGASYKESLHLIREGLTVEQIAHQRNLAISTIEGHLVRGIREGELEASYLVEQHKREKIIQVARQFGTNQLGPLKEELGEGFSYAEIRAAIAYQQYQEGLSSETGSIPVEKSRLAEE